MEHLTGDQLRGYESGALGAGALVEADRHLAACPACRHQLHQQVPPPRLPELVQQMEEPLHLTYEQMVGFADSSLEGPILQWVEQHTAICRRCARELRDLQEFDCRMAAELKSLPAAPNAAPWLQRLSEWFRSLAAPQRLNFAAAGVGLMVLGIFSLLQAAPAIPGKSEAQTGVSALVFSASASLHPQFFYGGFFIAGCGLALLLYGILRR